MVIEQEKIQKNSVEGKTRFMLAAISIFSSLTIVIFKA